LVSKRPGTPRRRGLRALLERAPRTARRRVDEVAVDDLVLVRPGEVLPVDGVVEGGPAVLDESALTGELELVERAAGDAVRSGTPNAGGAFEVRCSVPAAQSTYAGIIALVWQAGAENAPVIRLADRFAAWFLPLSLAVAGLARVVSGAPARAVTVLVVATPCPLLLAAPVAIVSGLSRSSRLGVVVRSGGALENLGRARTMVLDKTST
jgi:P-type E1-E2 ATPase